MTTWLVTYTNGRDEQKIKADRIREVGHLLAFSDDFKEPFLFITSAVINTITCLDPTNPSDG